MTLLFMLNQFDGVYFELLLTCFDIRNTIIMDKIIPRFYGNVLTSDEII